MVDEYGLEQFQSDLDDLTARGCSLVWGEIKENDSECMLVEGTLGLITVEVCTREQDEGRWFRSRLYVLGASVDGGQSKGVGPFVREGTLFKSVDGVLRQSGGLLRHAARDALKAGF